MSKVLFVSSNTELINMRILPLGLACVAEATKRDGHQVTVLDLAGEEDATFPLNRTFDTFEPDLIGVSVRNIDNQKMRQPVFLLEKVKPVIDICRRRSTAPIVLGGPGYSMFPRAALHYLGADMGIAGEGESAFPTLVTALAEGRALEELPGLWRRDAPSSVERTYQATLDRFSLPPVGLIAPTVDPSNDLWIPLQTRRGCAMGCRYCATEQIEGRRTRTRSPVAVVDWLADLQAAGHDQFYFVDNNFNIPRSFAQELCAAIDRRRLPIRWRCILNPGTVDESLIAAMAAAGCVSVSLGLESGSPVMLRNLNKQFTVEDIRTCATLLSAHGIETLGFLLLGGPGETVRTVEQSLAFADSLDLQSVRVTAGIRIYPHTELARIAVEQGIIDPEDDLLYPRFYLSPKLKGKLFDVLDQWKEKRLHWIID